jgi:caffeoyl-CoA O-methyltransferase
MMRYEDVQNYVQRLVGKGDKFQEQVYRKSKELGDHGVYPIDSTRGRFLELLARMNSATRVLEVGSGAGYSALWFTKGMSKGGSLDAIEVDAEVVEVLRGLMEKAGLQDRIRIYHGQALAVLRKLNGPYDLVFIDADKDEYPAYLNHALRLTRAGSVILADNMLWSGATVHGDSRRPGVGGIIEYTERIFADERLASIIIPLGDGLGVSYRIR